MAIWGAIWGAVLAEERIFVFIGVGVLMLVVGYFAPLPPVSGNSVGDRLKPAVA